MAEGDQYTTKGFIGEYGLSFSSRGVTTNFEQLKEFDVTPYKSMPFDQLRTMAEETVKATMKKFHVVKEVYDMGFLGILEMLQCFDSESGFVKELC